MLRKSKKVLFAIFAVLLLSVVLILNGCRKSHESFTDTDLFKMFVIDPVPASVTDLRIYRPKYLYGKVYVMNFKISSDDLQTILKAKPFVERSDWEFDPQDRYYPLRWKYYEIVGTDDEKKEFQRGIVREIITFDRDENGNIKPDWFKPDKLARLYSFDINNTPYNPNDITRHVLIYDVVLHEAYYLKYETGGL
jgi:hypothetical protein